MKNKTIKLFFLKGDFYGKSGSIMSPVYSVKTYERWDWGFVQTALREGVSISIRPATEKETRWAEAELGRLLVARDVSHQTIRRTDIS